MLFFISIFALTVISTTCSLRLYNSERLSNHQLEYDCFDYHVPDRSTSTQIKSITVSQTITYCIRPSYRSDDNPRMRIEITSVPYRSLETLTFGQWRYGVEITPKGMYQSVQFTSMDDIERYQIYFNTFNESMSQERLWRCGGRWFGAGCRYHLVEKELRWYDIDTPIDNVPDQKYLSNISNFELTCYTHLICNRGPPPICLDWREICDGKIDCADDDGIDEKFCDSFETHECTSNEFRCQNGRQCIPEEFFRDDPRNPDCQDGSDEFIVYNNRDGKTYPNQCFRDPAFRCEERTCKPNELACGDGQCVGDFDKCQNNRGRLLMMDIALAGFSQNFTRCPSIPYGCDIHIGSVVDCSTPCWAWNIGLCPVATAQQCAYAFSMLSPNDFQANDDVLIFYNYKRYMKNFHWLLIPNAHCDNNTYCSHANTDMHRGIIDICNTYKNKLGLVFMGKYSRTDLTATISRLLKRRHLSTNCNHPSLYRCQTTGKCVSKHRLLDGIRDCQEGDDEFYKDSCSFSDDYRYKCPNEEKCISYLAVLNGLNECFDGADERRAEDSSDSFSFHQICDGIYELNVYITNDTYESDETQCYDWPCNNIYTRCDGISNCPNGVDELNCTLPKCLSSEHTCFSLSNYQPQCYESRQILSDHSFICNDWSKCLDSTDLAAALLNRSKILCIFGDQCAKQQYSICDNQMDCHQGEDEYLCNSISSNILEFLFNCNSLLSLDECEYNDNICFNHRREKSLGAFSFRKSISYPPILMYPVGKNQLKSHIRKTSMSVDTTRITTNMKKVNLNEQLYCNRGIDTFVVASVNGALFERQCFCPPSYYGSRCQYQRDRISLTIQMRSAANQRIGMLLSVVLIDENYQMNSHNRLVYLSSKDCDKKYNLYLLYASYAKERTKMYSIHIDAFLQTNLSYYFSWHLPVPLSFIPVTRVATLLKIPASRSLSIRRENCQLQCKHGRCIEYINAHKHFCRCEPGWFGLLCDRMETCDCSSDSLCIGSIDNRSVCLCPSTKIGPRCLISHVCADIKCQNGGTCLPINYYIYLKESSSFRCICTDEFDGVICEIKKPTISFFVSEKMSNSSSIIAHLFGISFDGVHKQGTYFPKSHSHNNIFIIARPSSIDIHLVFVDLDNVYYLVFVQHRDYKLSSMTAKVSVDRQCFHIRDLFDSDTVYLHKFKRIKYYQKPCRTRQHLVCFYDDTYMCVCTSDRFAHCFQFNFRTDTSCKYENPCQNNGRCFRDHQHCPSRTECFCAECFYGTLCQFSTRSLDISLDAILGYQIQPFVAFIDQPLSVKISMTITMIMFLLGLVSGLLALITFQVKCTRESGCGNYLAASAITSIMTMSVFTLKFWLLFLTQNGFITNRTVLLINCHSMDFLVQICLSANNSFDACVAVERIITTVKGVAFNKSTSKRISLIVIPTLILVIIATYLADPFHRALLYDESDQRTWCIVRYPPSIQVWNMIVLSIHYIVPLVINVISGLSIIVITARKRSITNHQISYLDHLRKQFQSHKHLLISPIVLVIVYVPRLLIALLSECMKPTQEPWLYLGGYFVAFIPPLLIFPLFVLPSTLYQKEFVHRTKYLLSQMVGCCRCRH